MFDIEAARKSGYKDEEITKYLAQQTNFDIEAARKSGYKDEEIIDYLAKTPAPQKGVTGFEQQYSQLPSELQKTMTTRPPMFSAERVLDVVPEVAVGIGTGKATGKMPLGKGSLTSGVLMAGVEGWRQALQHLFATPAAPKTVMESLQRLGISGISGVAGEAGARGIGAGFRRVFGKPEKYAKMVTPEGREMIETLKPTGIHIPPDMPTSSRLLDEATNIIEGGFFGGKGYIGAKENVKKTASDLASGYVENITKGLSRGDLRATASKIIANNKKIFETAANEQYRNLDKIARGKGLSIADTMSFLDEASKGLPAVRGYANMLKRDFGLGKGDLPLTFTDAHKIRSLLIDKANAPATKLLGNKTKGAFKKASELIDDAMETASKTKPKLEQAWRNADSFYKGGADTFKNQLVNKLAVKDADSVVDLVINSKEPVDIQNAKKAIDNKETWKHIQGRWLEEVWRKADGSGEKILTQTKNVQKDVLNEIFPNNEIEPFLKYARTLAYAQTKGGTNVGRLGIQIAQTGAVLSLPFAMKKTGGLAATSAASILLIPAALGKAMTNKTITDFLIEGSKGFKTIEAASKFATRFTTQLAKEGIEYEIQSTKDDPWIMNQAIVKKREQQILDNISKSIPPVPKEQFKPRLGNSLGITEVKP